MTQAIERLIKKRVTGAPHTVIVRCAKEWRDECLGEVRKVLADPVHPLKFAAEAEADADGVHVTNLDVRAMLQLALELRTARAILWLVGGGKAASKAALRKVVEGIDWELYGEPGASFALKAASTASRIYHEGLLKEVVSEVLVARGLSAAASADEAQLLIEARLKKDVLTVGLHLTAQALHRRGYRAELKGQAPLREDLAAACVRVTLPTHAVDDVLAPFAGSGTLGFEALMELGRIAPAAFLDSALVAPFPATPAASRGHVRKALLQRATDAPRVRFVEIDPEQGEVLERNARAFCERVATGTQRSYEIDVAVGDFTAFDWAPYRGRHVYCPMNPPYGLRLAVKGGAERLYRGIAAALVRGRADGVASLTGFVLAADDACAAAFARALSDWTVTTRTFRHGGLPVQLVAFASH